MFLAMFALGLAGFVRDCFERRRYTVSIEIPLSALFRLLFPVLSACMDLGSGGLLERGWTGVVEIDEA